MQLLFARVFIMFLGIQFDEKPINTYEAFPFDSRLIEISLLSKYDVDHTLGCSVKTLFQ